MRIRATLVLVAVRWGQDRGGSFLERVCYLLAVDFLLRACPGEFPQFGDAASFVTAAF